MRSTMRRIASTAAPVEPCTAAIWPAISSVAFAVCTASDFTSEATTANPLPASPARAASIVALSAKRLVWPALLRITATAPLLGVVPVLAQVLRDRGENFGGVHVRGRYVHRRLGLGLHRALGALGSL